MAQKRKLSIYISGAHSVGKTTLQQALLSDREFSSYKFRGQEEIARIWIKAKGYTQAMLMDPVMLLQLQYELLTEQLRSEAAEVAECAGDVSGFLWDRCIIDGFIYTRVFCEKGAYDRMITVPEVQGELSRLQANQDAIVIIPKPRKEFVISDGLRRESDIVELHEIHNSMIQTLVELNIPHTVIEVADLAERVNIVLEIVKKKWPFLYGLTSDQNSKP